MPKKFQIESNKTTRQADKHQQQGKKTGLAGVKVTKKLSFRLKAGPSGYFETFLGVSACEGF